MLTTAEGLANEAKKLIQTQIDSLIEGVMAGHLEYGGYKYATGQYFGLKAAMQEIDEALAILNGKERGQ